MKIIFFLGLAPTFYSYLIKPHKMNGELDFDDILFFSDEILVKQLEKTFLVISVKTANWLVLRSEVQLSLMNELRCGNTIGQIVENIETEEKMTEFRSLLAAIFARKFAGVGKEPSKIYLEGYKMLNIYVTNACNLQCRHCFMSSGNKLKFELSSKDWMKVLSEFQRFGGEGVTFSGGEPLMHQGFPEILKHAHSIGLSVTVLTNGLLWTDQLICELGPCIDEIQFSIDGVNEETNSVIRGRGNFGTVVETVIKFSNLGIKTSVATTFTYENLEVDTPSKYKAFLDSINSLTDSKVFFKLSKKLLNGRNVEISSIQNEEYTVRIKEIERFVDENANYENFMVGHLPNLIGMNCGFGGISISAEGNVYFCNRISDVENYGHVSTHSLLYYMEKGREIHNATSVDNIEPCSTCFLRYICDGGCRIDDFDFHGKLKSAIKPYCQINCTEERKNNLMRRMIDSFNYFYDFD